MRLTCPNCGAQYEVPDDVIPPEGRDVQCSDCGTTWFQDGAEDTTAASEEMSEAISQAIAEPAATDAEPEAAGPVADEVYEDAAPSDEIAEDYSTADASAEDIDAEETAPADMDAADDAVEDDDEDGMAYDDAAEAAEVAPVSEAERPKRMLDGSVTDILREEAEREQALRSAEASGLETQPDLGLEEPPKDDLEQRAQQTRERMARLRGEDPEVVEEDYSGSRRGLLPDIEEINSSLRGGGYEAAAGAAAVGTAQDVATDKRQRSGFLRGFAVAVILAVLAALSYQNADKLSAQVPEAGPALDAYVGWVNEARVWLHTQVEQLAQDP